MIALLGSGHRLHKRAVIHKVGNARFFVRVGVLARAIPRIDGALCPLKLGADRAARRYVAPRAIGIFKLSNKAYMSAVVESEDGSKIDNEDQPAVIWRKSHDQIGRAHV